MTDFSTEVKEILTICCIVYGTCVVTASTVVSICLTNYSNNVSAVIGCFVLKSFSCTSKSCRTPYVVHKCVKTPGHFTLAYPVYLFLNDRKYASGTNVKRNFYILF